MAKSSVLKSSQTVSEGEKEFRGLLLKHKQEIDLTNINNSETRIKVLNSEFKEDNERKRNFQYFLNKLPQGYDTITNTRGDMSCGYRSILASLLLDSTNISETLKILSQALDKIDFSNLPDEHIAHKYAINFVKNKIKEWQGQAIRQNFDAANILNEINENQEVDLALIMAMREITTWTIEKNEKLPRFKELIDAEKAEAAIYNYANQRNINTALTPTAIHAISVAFNVNINYYNGGLFPNARNENLDKLEVPYIKETCTKSQAEINIFTIDGSHLRALSKTAYNDKKLQRKQSGKSTPPTLTDKELTAYLYQDNNIIAYVNKQIEILGGYDKAEKDGSTFIKDKQGQYKVSFAGCLWLDQDANTIILRKIVREIFSDYRKDQFPFKIVFAYNTNQLHWLSCEIIVKKNGESFEVEGIIHDPFGKGSFSPQLQKQIKDAFPTNTHTISFNFKDGKYSKRQQDDSTSCGLIASRDIIHLTKNEAISDKKYSRGCIEERKEDLKDKIITTDQIRINRRNREISTLKTNKMSDEKITIAQNIIKLLNDTQFTNIFTIDSTENKKILQTIKRNLVTQGSTNPNPDQISNSDIDKISIDNFKEPYKEVWNSLFEKDSQGYWIVKQDNIDLIVLLCDHSSSIHIERRHRTAELDRQPSTNTPDPNPKPDYAKTLVLQNKVKVLQYISDAIESFNDANPPTKEVKHQINKIIKTETGGKFLEPKHYCGIGAEVKYSLNKDKKTIEFEIINVFRNGFASSFPLSKGDKITIQYQDKTGSDPLKEIISAIRNIEKPDLIKSMSIAYKDGSEDNDFENKFFVNRERSELISNGKIVGVSQFKIDVNKEKQENEKAITSLYAP